MSMASKRREKIRKADSEAPSIAMVCFWCATSHIYETNWNKDAEGFWRCQWGHPANVDQKGILEEKWTPKD